MISSRKFKNAVFEQFARIGKAVGNPKRLELLDILGQGERTVEVLAREADISIASASQHLQSLKAARLVESEKHGSFVVYRLADQHVKDFLYSMRTLAEDRLAEIEVITRQYMERHSDMEPVGRDTLRERVLSGQVTLLDVRTEEEYRAGHLPGALCVPLESLEQYMESLPTDQEIVAYCRGPYCVLAVEAVERLRARGFTAFRLEDGVHEWQSLGLSIEENASQGL